jgi:hypothetical protein
MLVIEIEEKLEINFLQYWVSPKNHLTSITLLVLGETKVTLTLEGSIFSSPPLTIRPK